MATKELVMVTGGSGFLGVYCVIEALNHGYRVRTTTRSHKRFDEVRQMLLNGGIPQAQVNDVEFVEADLSNDEGWTEACRGCTYVLHVASPRLMEVPKNPDDMIKPATEGTLRVLKAAKEAGSVRRVVFTSSMGATFYGHPDRGRQPFTEVDWTNLSSGKVAPYPTSKTLSERAAWDYIAKEGGNMSLAVINPYAIFGPVLSKDFAPSMSIIVRLVTGQMPGVPKLSFGSVDVRDVASLHLLAMTSEKAKGERFIGVADDPALSMRELALRLKGLLEEDKGSKIPTMELPNFMVRFGSLFDKALGVIVPELGIVRKASSAKAKKVLGWKPRPLDETLRDAAESLFVHDLAKV